jgi:anti-anti-sigma factor
MVQHTVLSPHATLVQPVGRLDLGTSAAFRADCRELVKNGAQLLVIDMSQVEFLDSSGLGALVGALKTARQAGGDVKLVSVREQPRLILDLTRLERVLVIADSVQAALEPGTA